MAYTFLMALRLPGPLGSPLPRSGLTWLVVGAATVTALTGAAVLRRQPMAALALLLTAGVAAALVGGPADAPLAQFLAFDVALGFLAATRPRHDAVTGAFVAVGLFAGYLVVRIVSGFGVAITEQLLVVFAAVVAWLIGRSVYQRREHAWTLQERAAVEAVNAERLRIARDLHDIIAHNIGIVALQAGSANLVIDTQPAVVRQAMRSIETASRETLAGLRRMLVALRETDRAASCPAPGLADVDQLAAVAGAAGVQVDLRWQGARRPLTPEVDVSAYRIVQEAITNVVRHSGARSCQISITYQTDSVAIEVLDDGSGSDGTTGTGHGLIGMQERVGLLHGDFAAGPRPEGGFRVAARLPLLMERG
ncbi:histidine kinase [Dactylosporangium sp. NPDC005555]|uniref:sensor histidine kinase n=1 Tax=Dactylosporangium sp. NPDC005555 TaxID=3154889 RepID=UPI0033A48DBF